MRLTHSDRLLLEDLAGTVRKARTARRWTIDQLATASGLSPAHVGRVERLEVPEVSLRVARRLVSALGGELRLSYLGLGQAAPRQRDEAHARCVAYVARRLERDGRLVATEVEAQVGRARTFIDVLAFDPVRRHLLAGEVKTEIRDVGEIDRQVGLAERGAWEAAQRHGWRPAAVTAVLLALATEENERAIAANAAYVARYRLRARDLNADTAPERGERGLALIDPRTRRRDWLLPLYLDGRRTPPHRSRQDYLARRGA